MKKPTPTETTLRAKLAAREIDGATTKEIAIALGVTPATALRLLQKLESEGFTATRGGTLCHSEADAGRNSGANHSGSPTRFFWFFY